MKVRFFFSIAAVLIFTFTSCNSQEPTKWRGPSGEGIYSDTDLLDKWAEDGPEILWSYEALGQGHSSPVISGEYMYTSGMTDGAGYLFKFDLEGNLIYNKSYGPEYVESFYGPRGSPTIVGDKIYLTTGYGVLMCLEEENAEVVWELDMVNKFGGDTITWGYCETPVVDGNIVYATPGGKTDNVVALDRTDGSLIWSCEGKGELSAYCSPLLFDHNGRKILTTHTASHLLGIDAASGELLWAHSQPNKYSVHANTPVYRDGGLFYFSGYGKGSGKLLLNDDGTDVSLAWNNPMDSRMGGAVLLDGYLYGSGDKNRDWRCIDWETGEDVYTSDTIAKGVVIFADDKLYCYSDKGELALVNATPSEFDLLSKIRVKLGSEQHWAHPLIYKGVLYLRHGKAMIAYKIK